MKKGGTSSDDGCMDGRLAGSRRVVAAPGDTEGFAQLKSLVGHWEEQKVSQNKSTLDVELTAGGTTLVEKFRVVEQGKPVEMITMYYLDGGQLAYDARLLCTGDQDADLRIRERHESEERE